MQQHSNEIAIAVAIIFNQSDELLTVREKGSDYYQLPGGKIEHKERGYRRTTAGVTGRAKVNAPRDLFSNSGALKARKRLMKKATEYRDMCFNIRRCSKMWKFMFKLRLKKRDGYAKKNAEKLH